MEKMIPEAGLEENALLEKLQTTRDGLTAQEASTRIPKTKKELALGAQIILRILVRQLRSPLVILLAFAALLSFVLGEHIDALVIFGIIILNTVVAFIQEFHSYRILEKLKKFIPHMVSVRRAGVITKIAADLVVPGDIIFLRAGDIVPADIRLLDLHGLAVDESVITGESISVNKKLGMYGASTTESALPDNCIFQGTKITGGMGEGVVFRAAKETLFGSIGEKAKIAGHESLFEKNIFAFSRLLLIIVLAAMVAIFTLSLILQKGRVDFITLLLFVLALAIGILPEALPVVTTVTLSHGALRLAKKSVVVRRLSALEDFGNIDILCTDKTGTITENVMSVKEVMTETNRPDLLTWAYAAREEDASSNPFDIAIDAALSEVEKKSSLSFRRVQEVPFDAVRRLGSFIIEKNSRLTLIARGAPEEILKRSTKIQKNSVAIVLTEEEQHALLDQVKELGAKGLRTLAIATKMLETLPKDAMAHENELTFLGIIAFEDPLRQTAKHALTLASKLGLSIKILTGDHPNVARAVALEAGLIKAHEDILTSADLAKLGDEDLQEKLATVKVFARISPDDKFRIIKLLEKQGRKVAYMGDGVNDVPSLAQAHIGIAVPGATPAAKEIADIVLLQKDLNVIVDGLLEGRKIFSNITKYLKYSLGGNLGNFISLAVISLFSTRLPQLPTQILLGNFVSDFPLLGIGWDTTDVAELRRPQNYNLGTIKNRALMFAILSSVFDFVFFGFFWHLPTPLMRTLWFIESMLTEIILIFSVRSMKSALAKPRPSSVLSILSILAILITVALPYTPIGSVFHFVAPPFQMLFFIFLLSFVYLGANELLKRIMRFLNGGTQASTR